MKKLITILIALLLSTSSMAAEVIQVVWSAALGNNQGNLVRTITENANKIQDKYTFVFISKQGGAGALAANTVLSLHKPAILAMSSTFYLTPILLKDSYSVDKFQLMSLLCVDRPLALYSKKLNSLDTNAMIFIGDGGGPTTLLTKLVANALPKLNITQVPFKTAPDATLAMIGGHIDASVDWLGAYNTVVIPGNGVTLLGITGKKHIIDNVPLLPGTEHLIADLLLFVPTSIDPTLYKELHQIFNLAQDVNTNMYCKNDYGRSTKVEFQQLNRIHELNKTRWKNMTNGVTTE